MIVAAAVNINDMNICEIHINKYDRVSQDFS